MAHKQVLVSGMEPIRVHKRVCGSVGSKRRLTGSHGTVRLLTIIQTLTCPIRGFATHTGPALAVKSGYGQFAHWHTTFCRFILDFVDGFGAF